MKRSVKLLALLGVLVLVCGGYFLLQNRSTQTETVTETTGSYALNDKTADSITGIAWTDADTAWHFVKTDGTWMKADAAAFPVNQSALNTMADKLGGLTAIRKITDVTAPADYGMTEPRQVVTVTYDDGSTATFTEGSETPFGDGCYLQVSGQDDVVYTIASTLTTTFSKNLSDLAVKETITLPEEPTHIAVGTALDVTRTDAGWAETATGLAADADKVQAVLDDISGLTWSTLVTAAASDSELEAFGLNAEAGTPVTVENADTAWQLLIGGTDSSGASYARLADSRMVYTISASDAKAILGTKTEDLWPADIFTAVLADVKEITFTTDSGTYALTPVTAQAEAAASETDEPAAAPETSLASEKDSSLFSRLTALKATARADAEKAAGKQLLSVRIVMNTGAETELTFREYDIDSYAVSRPAYPDRLVSAGDTDTLLRILRSE